MADSPAVAQARLVYEQFQADHLAATPLSQMADWIATGSPPPAEALRAFGFVTAESPKAADLRWARKAFIRDWGYAIPCAEAVAALRDLGPLLEVGCGSAYWTALLRSAGLDCIATDAASGRSAYGFEIGQHAPAEQLTAAQAIERHPGRNLFCAWPDPAQPWIADAVRLMPSGRTIALILDERPEMTGDAGLIATLDEVCAPLGAVVIPQFPGVRDRLVIHRRV